MKLHFTTNNIEDLIRWVGAHHKQFTMEKTGYSVKIKAGDHVYLAADKLTNPSVFKAYNMIKKDIGESTAPYVKRTEIVYWNFESLQAQNCYSIDLNRAYPQALFNLGYISKKTFQFLTGPNIKKEDRLKAMGMMASKKIVIDIQDGKIKQIHPPKENNLANFFYLACKIVGNLMIEAAKNEGFLFFWVDGLFTTENPQRIRQFFVEQGFPAKIERVKNMEVLQNGTWLYYEKEGQDKLQPIPQKQRVTDSEILHYIQTGID
jgi:hypothetical protein